ALISGCRGSYGGTALEAARRHALGRGARLDRGPPGHSARRRGLWRKELDRARVGDLPVEYQEGVQAVVGVVDRVGRIAAADGCLGDRHLGRGDASGAAGKQVVLRVLAPVPAAYNIDVWIVVAVDIADRERPGALDVLLNDFLLAEVVGRELK